MKTRDKIPQLAVIPTVLSTGIETLQPMKTRLTTMLKFLIVLCSAFATTAGFGQNTFIYTNVNNANIGLAASWTNAATGANGVPSGATQDTAQWNGVTPGNLVVNYDTGWGNSGFGTSGINIICTTNQVGNVQITTTLTGGGSPAAGIFGITNNSPSGVLRIGETSSGGTSKSLNLATRPGNAGTIHGFVNNSTSAAIMDSSLIWVAGGGVACVMDFSGTGDWTVNHNMRDNNSGAGPITINWAGPGTMNWTPGGVFLSSDPLGPITINGGTVVLKGAGLCLNFSGVPAGNNTITNNGALLKYDAVGISDTIPRLIKGTGTLHVNNGTLTLSGANEYTGPTLLNSGELIVGSAENLGSSGPLGVGGTISFNGGTLGFNAANTYDYSPRFNTAAGQAYRFDTHGLSAQLTNILGSSGGTLTKLGSGTLTLTGANTYGGTTTVGAGKLVIQGAAGSGAITVSNSAALGVTAGTPVTPATLTVGTSGSATLEFNNVSSTTTALLASGGAVSVGGPITVNVNSGTFAIGQSYPLFSWTSGSAPAVTLGTLTGAGGNLTTNGNTIKLNITSLAFVWTGANNGNWVNAPSNWKVNGVVTAWADGGTALFDDSATGETNVVVNAPVLPAGVTVNSSARIYSIASSGANNIGGTGGLTKNGTTTLTLSGGVNTYTGVTTLSGGTVSVGTLSSGGSPSDIGSAGSSAASLVFNGGALQYTGSAAGVNHLFTLGTGGGTIDSSGSGALNLNNAGSVALSGTGARVLTLAGTGADTNTLAAVLADNGGATALTKNGAGTWVLAGNNTYSGVTTIGGGTLQIGTGGATGSPGTGNIVNNGSIAFNRSGTLTVGTITGTGSLTNDGSGTIILPGDNTYQNGTTINAGTLQIGNGGATGKIDASDPILNNGTLIVNSTGDLTLSGAITGTGNLIKRGSGLLKLLGTGTAYTGTTTIDPGARLQIWQGNTGGNTSPFMTNNGTLIMMRQDNGIAIYAGNISGSGLVRVEVSNGNSGDSTLTGTNTYTGGTYILGGGLVLGNNGLTPYGGSIVGNVFLTNDYIHNTFGTAPNDFVPATLTFSRAEDFTFPGNIVGNGFVTHNGFGTTTLTGNNTYTNTGNGASTTINAGTLQVGNGGTTGSLGTGSIADNSILVFNRSDALTINRGISGSGAVVQFGAGTTTLAGANTYSGATTVSNGTLVVTGGAIGGDLNVEGGTFAPASLSAGGQVTVAGNMTIDAGTVLVPLNKSLLPQTNINVTGTLTRNGGVLVVTNVGSALVVNDKFYIFSQPVTGLTVSGAGATWQNDLAVDGSITALTVTAVVNPNPPTVQFSVSGSTLSLAWPTNLGWILQTNSVAVNLTNQWFTYPGSTSLTNVNLTINPAKTNVYFRMVKP